MKETLTLSTATSENITNDLGAVSFKCPSCGKVDIVRSSSERKNAVRYICPACGFTGPN
ncbi:MAG: RNA-binding protein [Candidatus Woesearchaeota archaeon]|nr:MAG: RNA-binding protein [Candidatus Woesearchaeota archaeon]